MVPTWFGLTLLAEWALIYYIGAYSFRAFWYFNNLGALIT